MRRSYVRANSPGTWDATVDDAGFERLIYNLLRDGDGYQRVQWLTNANAPDRGRDLSAERTLSDALTGAQNQRIIVQCKHYRSRSIRSADASEAVTAAGLWRPPFDVLVLATSGRFTTDAVDWIEGHNREQRLQIEMWPESHLESLLASRPWLVREMGMRAD